MNSLGINKKNQDTKVCVAMSGGVDSTAAVIMLRQEGYDVFGLTMDLLQSPYAPESNSIADAGKMAEKLGIKHEYLDLKREFYEQVVQYFSKGYLEGITPSPCIMCNKNIKLGILAEEAKKRGADILVTGHYANIKLTESGVELHRAKDLIRDQSYFLFGISRENLQILRCPLAEFSKQETREIVKKAGLEIYKKADSQDICFVQNGKYVDLIKKLNPQYEPQSGDIVNTTGKVLGQHNGIINYTIGQRRGLGIGGGDILYVLRIEALKNQVIVGAYEELKSTKLLVKGVNWLASSRPQQLELEVKLRSRQNLVAAKVKFLDDEMAEVELLHDFYGVAPGQGCCFYKNSRVLGGGIIGK